MIEIQQPPRRQVVAAGNVTQHLSKQDQAKLEGAVAQEANRTDAFDILLDLTRLDENEAALVRDDLESATRFADQIRQLVLVTEDDFWQRISQFLTWPTDELHGIPVRRFANRSRAENWLAVRGPKTGPD